jgi:iodotyrosine deiodinase
MSSAVSLVIWCGSPGLKINASPASIGDVVAQWWKREGTGPVTLPWLAPLGTDSNKPFLEIAPWLIAVFAQPFRILPDGTRSPTYYAIESVGIATGMLVTAVHSCGLVSLTHTPSPMGFLNRILKRPSYEKPFVLLVVGHPAQNAFVPDIGRKPLDEISSFVTP